MRGSMAKGLMMPALFLICMTVLAPAKNSQDAKDGAKTAALEARLAVLEKSVADQRDELDRLNRVADGLAIGAARLAAAAELAKAHGFAEAGANPASRLDLLTGIETFHETVKKALEKPAPKPAEKGEGN